jgi:hypothetical protein
LVFNFIGKMPSSKKPCNVEECPEGYDAFGTITYEEEKIAESKDPLAGRHSSEF